MVQAVMPYLPKEILRISVAHNDTDYETDIALANGEWVDWVVAVSDGIRERTERGNRAKVKLATIPVGLEIPSTGRRAKGGLLPLRLIYVGRMVPQKNIPGLLRVLSSLQEAAVPFAMTIVGDGPELESARAATANSRYGAQVRFMGSRTPEEVRRLLSEHDFLLMTSHFEGTPHVLLEGMANGLVVVGPHLPGSTDRIVRHGVDGFLCDRNQPGEYVAVLRRVAANPAEFAAVSQAAQRAMQARYSVDTLAAQYERLFDSRSDVPPKIESCKLDAHISIPPALLPNFPGLLLQCKHRVADVWHNLAHGRRPVAREPRLEPAGQTFAPAGNG
jgi:glycosyltransferase involved in cell wall biosynthesis